MAIKLSQKEISLDLQHQGFTNTIYVQEGDVDSRELTISLFDDGEEYNISSSSKVYLSGERSDKAVVSREVDSFTNNIIKVVFRNEEICAKGISKYKIIIKDADDVLSSVYFKIKVYENVYDENGILATPQYSELQEAIKKADSIDDSVKSVKDSLNSEISRAKSAEKTNSDAISSETARATAKENEIANNLSVLETNLGDLKKEEVDNKIESEVATDFSQADTPQFQQTIDDVFEEVNELKSDLENLPSLLGYERKNSEVAPIVYTYNSIGSSGGTLVDDNTLTIPSNASMYNTRIGRAFVFRGSYFIGKKFLLSPHFEYSGDVSHFIITVTKQNNVDAILTVIDDDMNNPKILVDCTNATSAGMDYAYVYVIFGGVGNYNVSEDTTITYIGYDLIEYEYSSKNIENLKEKNLYLENIIKSNTSRIYALENKENNSFDLINPCTVNIFDKTKAKTDGYYDSNGIFVNNNSYVISTDFIPIVYGEYISMNRLEGSLPIIDFWDSNKTFLGTVSARYVKCEYENCAFVTMTFFPSEIDNLVITKGVINTVAGEIGYSSCLRRFNIGEPLTTKKTHWYGKHLATIGDSLTQMGYWQDHVCNTLGMTYTKYAQSGGNMVRIATFIDEVTEVPDLFTIWAGTNDWAGGIVLGSFLSNDASTYAGAINTLCQKLSSNFGNSRILFITPMQRGDITTGNKNNKGYYVNSNGDSLEDFANMCKQTAEYYGFNCLDMFHDSGVNSINITNYSGDKLHPDLHGFERLAHHKLIPKIMSI